MESEFHRLGATSRDANGMWGRELRMFRTDEQSEINIYSSKLEFPKEVAVSLDIAEIRSIDSVISSDVGMSIIRGKSACVALYVISVVSRVSGRWLNDLFLRTSPYHFTLPK